MFENYFKKQFNMKIYLVFNCSQNNFLRNIQKNCFWVVFISFL